MSFYRDHSDETMVCEDVLGENGFRALWVHTDYWAEVWLYKRWDDGSGTQMFENADSHFSPDPTPHLHLAEVYMRGSFKWDSCSNLDMHLSQGYEHRCSSEQLAQHAWLMRYIWCRAGVLMEREGDYDYDDFPLEFVNRSKNKSYDAPPVPVPIDPLVGPQMRKVLFTNLVQQ